MLAHFQGRSLDAARGRLWPAFAQAEAKSRSTRSRPSRTAAIPHRYRRLRQSRHRDRAQGENQWWCSLRLARLCRCIRDCGDRGRRAMRCRGKHVQRTVYRSRIFLARSRASTRWHCQLGRRCLAHWVQSGRRAQFVEIRRCSRSGWPDAIARASMRHRRCHVCKCCRRLLAGVRPAAIRPDSAADSGGG